MVKKGSQIVNQAYKLITRKSTKAVLAESENPGSETVPIMVTRLCYVKNTFRYV